MHNIIIDHKRQQFVDQYSSVSHPFRVNVCSLADGSVLRTLYVNKDPRLDRWVYYWVYYYYYLLLLLLRAVCKHGTSAPSKSGEVCVRFFFFFFFF